MSTLRIYDTKGNAYSPDGTATGSNEQVKELFYGGVRLAIRSDHRREISLFFRARETRNARTEQFYAVYSVDDSSTPLQDLITDLTTRVESEWGYSIDDSSEEMQVYRDLKRGNTALPGGSTEQGILSKLISSRQPVVVGVQDERNAIGLLSEYLDEYDQAAIADSEDADVLSTFDFVVTPNGTRGITPLGETEARWESTSRSLRDKHIKQEIASIRESVETLSREHGLSNGEIRDRIQSSVPALKASTTSSDLRTSASGSDDDYLVPPKVGLYVAVGAAVLLVLFAAIYFGVFGFIGATNGSGQTSSQANITGVVIDSTTGNPLNSSTRNVYVTLNNETGAVVKNASQPQYAFTVSKARLSNLTLKASADGYQNQTRDLSGDSREINISLVPASTDADSATLSRVQGQVVDSTNDAAISDANISLIGTENRVVKTNLIGNYTFEEIPPGEYTLSVTADGYVASESRTISVNGTTTQVDDINLDPTAALSILVTDSNADAGVAGASVYLYDNSTRKSVNSSTTDQAGWYNVSDLAPGTYDIEARPDGYDNKEKTYEVKPGAARVIEITVISDS
ncbi:MSCRAMM family protein [Halorubrum coriense]|uniref:MSCRAMM family protein n=1 Tax=Halorubrum coriense TaxID=64713 RepID=UPI0009B5A782|nr:carboxypeptidase-like regulatory domain-containing protein [Halorubrum coriense]